ncbi:Mov34/MPN/PAD-1 family protein [Cronobacter sakazakii]|nr:Mov34/MPN/PAD-1 family protein [Cronobacter sakazakii]ELY4325139.1 Mov34/MPN/PAD-1 family protein [Cronobacter sakazakii]ELY4764236.1 Mov34/MPN/PAD-1 family protein [Cronobacter sakazakii]ELY4849403.1 Mov34/MPN/PAD-1 family protein [Cronobacter sakazakii]ELY5875509.1 Mov34/MPN/PAD-1 family protein [Cronobacter sakazakii]
MATDAQSPSLNLREEEMHLASIEIGGMTKGADCGFLAGNDVGHFTAFVNETGGILIGSYSEDSSTARIVEATTRPVDSLAGRTTFQRGVRGLRPLLHARWKTGLYYVGEWHFHPGGSPEPSGDDFRSMTSIAANPDYQCLEPVMIILGGDPAGSYSLSASVFPRGDAPIRLREILI